MTDAGSTATHPAEPVSPRHRRASLLQKLVHFLTALTLTLKGISKMEHPHGYEAVIALFLASAIYIVAITIFHDRLHAHVRLLTGSVYAIESLVSAVMAWVYFHEGKHGLPYAFVLAAILFAIALVVQWRRSRG
jgi:hypothetical protein